MPLHILKKYLSQLFSVFGCVLCSRDRSSDSSCAEVSPASMWRLADPSHLDRAQSANATDDVQELSAQQHQHQQQQQWLEKQSGREGISRSEARDAPGMHQRTCSQTDTAYSSSPQSPTHASGSGPDTLEGELHHVFTAHCRNALQDSHVLLRSSHSTAGDESTDIPLC